MLSVSRRVSASMEGRSVHALMLIAACAGCAGADGGTSRANAPYVEDSIFVPRGEQGVHYADEEVEELRAWGPSAVRADADGSFWIADAAANRLVHIGEHGGYLGNIDLEGQV